MLLKRIALICLRILGWDIDQTFPEVKKSIIIFAPHTSYFDGLFGKLYLINAGVKHVFLSKKEFFRFPYNFFFNAYGSIPVYKDIAFIDKVVKMFDSNDKLHIILSPEGQLAPTSRWKKGFYYMAVKANVPIIVGFIDYEKRRVGFKQVIWNVGTCEETMIEISRQYRNVTAKYPERFLIDSRYRKHFDNNTD
mgnify:CR=1 FL=1